VSKINIFYFNILDKTIMQHIIEWLLKNYIQLKKTWNKTLHKINLLLRLDDNVTLTLTCKFQYINIYDDILCIQLFTISNEGCWWMIYYFIFIQDCTQAMYSRYINYVVTSLSCGAKEINSLYVCIFVCNCKFSELDGILANASTDFE